MRKSNHMLTRTLFLDIETVSQKAKFEDLSENMRTYWALKCRQRNHFGDQEKTDDEIKDLYKSKAAIFAEFGKVVCISVGTYIFKGGEFIYRQKSFYGFNEEQLLFRFCHLLNTHYNFPDRFFICGHNIREFDIPFICRRLSILGIKLPKIIDVSGRKPWELNHLKDTMQLWKFGDYKHYTSMSLLCEIMGVKSPKEILDGSKVGDTYWKEQNIKKIKKYCESDVYACSELYIKMMQIDIKKGEENTLRKVG